MDALTTFLEGLMSFVSPCVLPMLPVYVLYFTGGEGETRRGRTLLRAVCFVLGFTLVFVLLGVFAGTLGALLMRWQRGVSVITGVIIVLLGLHFAGIVHIAALDKTLHPAARLQPTGCVSCLLLGALFSVGWTPCTGPMLGAAMMLAANQGSAGAGAFLLLCYGLGLGVPFVLCALAIDALKGALDWVKRHYGVINRVCGVFLIVVGVLMATGLYARLPLLLTAAQTETPEAAVQTPAPQEKAAAPATTQAAAQTPTTAPTESPATVQNAEAAGPVQKNMAPDFVAFDAAGETVSLSGMRGRPVVVNFFASWCGPCQREMPLFEAVWQEYGERIEFMMVDLCGAGFDDKEAAKALVEQAGYTFPVYFDDGSQAAAHYAIRSIPTSVFVAADGELIGKWVGMIDEQSLRGYLDMLLGE
ncbi:MAG: redoxin domain-containing protein [Clostridiales bacterium]|nr:redoxin domain-containing protein [Clostridiales bacterium]